MSTCLSSQETWCIVKRDLPNVEWFLSARILSTDCLHLHATAQLLFRRTEYAIGVGCMHECIQFREKTKYSRIAVRIPADLERACRQLAHNEGWRLGDLYRGLIVLGASGSFLMLRSRKSREFSLGSGFPSVLKQFLGRRVYAPRTGKRLRLVTICLPNRLAYFVTEYSNLSGRMRSHMYTRLLRAGLIVYLTGEHELVDRLKTANATTSVRRNNERR